MQVINHLLYFGLQDALPPPQIWEENGGASYSPNVAYLACWEGAGGGGVGFCFLFSSSKT